MDQYPRCEEWFADGDLHDHREAYPVVVGGIIWPGQDLHGEPRVEGFIQLGGDRCGYTGVFLCFPGY